MHVSARYLSVLPILWALDAPGPAPCFCDRHGGGECTSPPSRNGGRGATAVLRQERQASRGLQHRDWWLSHIPFSRGAT
eukprot:4280531-Prymnesium_polylepis.1